MTNFAHTGREVRLLSDSLTIAPALQKGFYTIEIDGMTGELYLNRIDPFVLPSVFYGDLEIKARRIVNTARDRAGVTGVLLGGEKGSGKTLLGKKVAMDLFENDGQSVIVLNKPIGGDYLGSLLQRLGAPVTLFLDEFEKVYSEDKQEAMLTVLDGVFPMKLTAIITANSHDRIVQPLINRPGRMFYNIAYRGLGVDFVRDYATAKLKDAAQVEEMCRLATLVELNFDQVQALCEEMNRYDEPLLDAVQFLNIDIATGEQSYTTAGIVYRGHTIHERDIQTFSVYAQLLGREPDDDDVIGIVCEVPNLDHKTVRELMQLPQVMRAIPRYRHVDAYKPFQVAANIGFGLDAEEESAIQAAGDHVPEKMPYHLALSGAFKVEARNGLIAVSQTERTSEGQEEFTLLLKRPYSSGAKVF